MKKPFPAVVLLVIVSTAAIVWYYQQRKASVVPKTQPYSFEACVAAGYSVAESFPRQCTAGKFTFVEPVEQSQVAPSPQAEPVVLDNVQAYQLITSPLHVTGKALGNWFFEANIGLRLLDAEGKEFARGQAEATGDWMTTEMVPFRGDIAFTAPATSTGYIEIEKDNPSDNNELDASVRVPVRFK